MPKHYILLVAAILTETIGTTALQASSQFSKLIPSIIVVIAYSTSFYLLGLSLKFFPVGVMYALWSGLGIVFIAIIGWLVFGQKLDLWAVVGISLILAGILVLHLLSSTSTHR